MKVTVDRMTLKDALAACKPFVAARSALPILTHVHVFADSDDVVTLTATDGDTVARVTVDAVVHSTGEASLPFRELADSVKAGPATVTLAGEDGSVLVEGAARRMLRTGDLDEWPSLPAPTAGGQELPVDTVRRVLSAASKDDARPILTAVQLGTRDGELWAAATDSYRLTYGRLGASQLDCDALVPSWVLASVVKLAKDSPLRVAVGDIVERAGGSRGADHVTLSTVSWRGPKRAPRIIGVTVVARTVEGTFPDWRQLVPSATDGFAAVSPVELSAAVAAVTPAADGGQRPVILSAVDDGWRLTAGDDEHGKAEAGPVPLHAMAGDVPDVIAFNPRYLSDALAAATSHGDRVEVRLRDELKPAVWGPALAELGAGEVGYLLMPVRIG